MALNPGTPAPDATLFQTNAQTSVRLADLMGDGPALLLFYPLAFSSTCTEEMCTVADDYTAYQELGATVLAVSVDSPYVAAAFARECGADNLFLSDFNREASAAYDVLRETLGGLEGVSERAAFVVADGMVTYAWVGEHPGVFPPLEEIKAALAGV